VLQSVIIVRERATSVVGRIDKDAFHLPGIVCLERFQREQIVSVDQHIVEDVIITDTRRRVVAFLRFLDQNARLQPRTVLLAHPGQFKFLFLRGHVTSLIWGALEARYLKSFMG